MPKPANPERARLAKSLREKIHRAFRHNEPARELMQNFRAQEMFVPLGFASFHAWSKVDSPWPVSYSYQLSKLDKKIKKPTGPRKPPPAPSPDPEPAQPADEMIPLIDHAGQTIALSLEHIFRIGNQNFFEITASIETIRSRLRGLCSSAAGANLSLYNRAEVIRQHLDSMEGVIGRCRPWAQCPYCGPNYGAVEPVTPPKCRACDSKGWLTQDQWTEATKATRAPV